MTVSNRKWRLTFIRGKGFNKEEQYHDLMHMHDFIHVFGTAQAYRKQYEVGERLVCINMGAPFDNAR